MAILAEALFLEIDVVEREYVARQLGRNVRRLIRRQLDAERRRLKLPYVLGQIVRLAQASTESVHVLERVGAYHAQVLDHFGHVHLGRFPLNDHVLGLDNHWFLLVALLENNLPFELWVGQPSFDKDRLWFRRQRCYVCVDDIR